MKKKFQFLRRRNTDTALVPKFSLPLHYAIPSYEQAFQWSRSFDSLLNDKCKLHKDDVWFVFTASCLQVGSCLLSVICVCLRIVVNIWITYKRQEPLSLLVRWGSSLVFGEVLVAHLSSFSVLCLLVCLSSTCISCTLCCQPLWILHSWLCLRFSLTLLPQL